MNVRLQAYRKTPMTTTSLAWQEQEQNREANRKVQDRLMPEITFDPVVEVLPAFAAARQAGHWVMAR